MRWLLLSISILTVPALAQYDGPESVEYDWDGDRYFVSNKNDGTITELTTTGSTSTFASGMTSGPHGLEIMGDTLYACSGGTIKGFNLSSGAQDVDINLGALFLNGITTDGNFLYVTDFSAQIIYRVNPRAGTFNTYVSSTSGPPNGIVYDPTGDRFVVVFWGSSAAIKEVMPSDSSISTITTTTLTNLDGITIDCAGRFYVTSWSPQRLTQWDAAFTTSTDMGASVNLAADIDYDAYDQVDIPNSGNNTVELHLIADCAGSVPEVNFSFEVYPNPFTNQIRIEGDGLNPNTEVKVEDVSGRLVYHSKKLLNTIDLPELKDGVYAITVIQGGQRLTKRVVKTGY